ncbi:hypothetical protein [Streptomyces sp. YIM S03343]
MISDALFVARELADDPYSTEPVIPWRDVRNVPHDTWRAWEVRADEDRVRWELDPWVGVGPLRFGMRPEEVARALGGEKCAARNPVIEHPLGWEWELEWERYEESGVTAHYRAGLFLLAVTIDGRTGPQVTVEGTKLIGEPPSAVYETMLDHVETHNLRLTFETSGDPSVYELGLILEKTRAGDSAVSGATFATRMWMDNS